MAVASTVASARHSWLTAWAIPSAGQGPATPSSVVLEPLVDGSSFGWSPHPGRVGSSLGVAGAVLMRPEEVLLCRDLRPTDGDRLLEKVLPQSSSKRDVRFRSGVPWPQFRRSDRSFRLVGVLERECARSRWLGVGDRDLDIWGCSGARVCSFLGRGVGLRLRRSRLLALGDRLLVERFMVPDLRVAAVGIGMKVEPPLLLLVLEVEDRRVRGGDLDKKVVSTR